MKYILKPIFIFIYWILVSVWIFIGKFIVLVIDGLFITLSFLWLFKNNWEPISTLDFVWVSFDGSRFENHWTHKTWHKMYFPWKYGK
jgi:hypothetical protein